MKPYEKFMRFGAQALTNEELLAIMIRTGTREKSALQVAEAILSKNAGYAGKLQGLYHLSLTELMEFDGIGEVKAVKIKCITELSMRISKEAFGNKLNCTSPETIASFYMEEYRHLEQEQVVLLCLNNKMQLMGEHILSTGTINASILSPRDVFIKAVSEKAVYILLLHNHPSGDPAPSRQDIDISHKIMEIGRASCRERV